MNAISTAGMLLYVIILGVSLRNKGITLKHVLYNPSVRHITTSKTFQEFCIGKVLSFFHPQDLKLAPRCI